MTTDISGITPSFYQDIYPAASLASGAKTQPAGATGPVQTGLKAVGGDEAQFSPEATKQASQAGETNTKSDGTRSEAEQRQIDALQQDDRRVRSHEQAHISAGGGLTSGGATFQYKTGPDGKQYAVGGEVQIDTSEEKDPSATIRKATRIKAAALAPADPSAQDRSVAASADAMAIKARQELAQTQSGGGAQSSGQSSGQAAATMQSGPTNVNLARAKTAYGIQPNKATSSQGQVNWMA
jgi:hypothetical protein